MLHSYYCLYSAGAGGRSWLWNSASGGRGIVFSARSYGTPRVPSTFVPGCFSVSKHVCSANFAFSGTKVLRKRGFARTPLLRARLFPPILVGFRPPDEAETHFPRFEFPSRPPCLSTFVPPPALVNWPPNTAYPSKATEEHI